MRFGAFAGIAVVVLAAGALSACSGSGETSPTTPPPSTIRATSTHAPSPTPSPTPTLTAEQQAALAAYNGFMAATAQGERDPVHMKAASLARFATYPVLGDTLGSITRLQIGGIEFHGDPPRSRVKFIGPMTRENLGLELNLSDCPTTSRSWRAYYVRTERPAETATLKVPLPYRSKITMVFLKGAWRVRLISTDSSRTCVQ